MVHQEPQAQQAELQVYHDLQVLQAPQVYLVFPVQTELPVYQALQDYQVQVALQAYQVRQV